MKPTTFFLIGAVILTSGCASTSALDERGNRTAFWGERMARIGQPARGDVLCFEPVGQFELADGETVSNSAAGVVTISSPRGEFTIHPNTFDQPAPEPVALANRDMMGGFYRYQEPGIGYLITVANPVQEGEFPVAWIEGPALTGTATDSSIYSRFGFGLSSDACPDGS
ncbi:MAG: hypothetical protein ACK4MH_02515 [Brevundimonas sp.]|uniref:hypothetical protein n=1 Tax=Brevundimonas sp. TaxID=1871086 RepID=UPI00391D1627